MMPTGRKWLMVLGFAWPGRKWDLDTFVVLRKLQGSSRLSTHNLDLLTDAQTAEAELDF